MLTAAREGDRGGQVVDAGGGREDPAMAVLARAVAPARQRLQNLVLAVNTFEHSVWHGMWQFYRGIVGKSPRFEEEQKEEKQGEGTAAIAFGYGLNARYQDYRTRLHALEADHLDRRRRLAEAERERARRGRFEDVPVYDVDGNQAGWRRAWVSTGAGGGGGGMQAGGVGFGAEGVGAGGSPEEQLAAGVAMALGTTAAAGRPSGASEEVLR